MRVRFGKANLVLWFFDSKEKYAKVFVPYIFRKVSNLKANQEPIEVG